MMKYENKCMICYDEDENEFVMIYDEIWEIIIMEKSWWVNMIILKSCDEFDRIREMKYEFEDDKVSEKKFLSFKFFGFEQWGSNEVELSRVEGRWRVWDIEKKRLKSVKKEEKE